VTTDSFGARLRAERERKHIDLVTIAELTKVKASLFESLERDDARGWPSGIYRRAFIRAYAEAIGMDPQPIVREFLARFPDPNDETTHSAPPAAARPAPVREPLRLMLDDSESNFISMHVRPTPGVGQRARAALIDCFVVAVVAVAVWAVTGLFWRPFALVTVCYYFGGAVLWGSAPATSLAARWPRRKKVRPPVEPAIVQLATERSRHRASRSDAILIPNP
jgi:transcriptional regulator with XRE-family HTH domain